MKKSKALLAFEQLEAEMEIISKEQANEVKGGFASPGTTIYIYRFASGSNGTSTNSDDWTLSFYEGYGSNGSQTSGYFLEPGGTPTGASGTDSPIPAGTYQLNYNPTTKGMYELYNNGVSTGRHIKIHPGNTGNDTEGCLLPGTDYNINGSNGSVSGSRAEYDNLMQFIQNNGGYTGVEIVIAN